MDHLPGGSVPGPPRLVRQAQGARRVLAPQAGMLFSIKLMLYILTFCVSHGFTVCSKEKKRKEGTIESPMGLGSLTERASQAGWANSLPDNGAPSYLHLAGTGKLTP